MSKTPVPVGVCIFGGFQKKDQVWRIVICTSSCGTGRQNGPNGTTAMRRSATNLRCRLVHSFVSWHMMWINTQGIPWEAMTQPLFSHDSPTIEGQIAERYCLFNSRPAGVSPCGSAVSLLELFSGDWCCSILTCPCYVVWQRQIDHLPPCI